MKRLPIALTLLLAIGCGQDDDPEGARVLWEKANAGAGFQSWRRAPGFATRKPSFTSHANAVEIFVSPEIVTVLDTKQVTEWPLGSIVVKEGFSGSSRKLVAIMEKRSDGWFWAEYDDGGTAKYSGRPSVCIDCHDNRKSYSDWVYSFELPR
jgi:Cytochrome P460